MNSRLRAAAVIIPFSVVTLGCSTLKVTTDWDAEADFSAANSYAVFERASTPDRAGQRRREAVSPLVSERINRSLAATFATRGLQATSASRADLLVTADVFLRERVVRWHTGYAAPRRWYWGASWGTTHVQRYREGTLVIDVLDRRSRTLIWRGVGEGAFTTPNPSADSVRRTVEKILADFPPPHS